MPSPPTIDAYGAFVLDGEDAARVPIDASAQLNSEAQPPEPAAPPLQRPHYLTFEELIDQELIHTDVVNRDE
jgi:hypothetical protein